MEHGTAATSDWDVGGGEMAAGSAPGRGRKRKSRWDTSDKKDARNTPTVTPVPLQSGTDPHDPVAAAAARAAAIASRLGQGNSSGPGASPASVVNRDATTSSKISEKVDINSIPADNRTYLCKGAVQRQLMDEYGVHIRVRGVYQGRDAGAGEEEPIHLFVEGSAEGVGRAVPRLQAIAQYGRSGRPAPVPPATTTTTTSTTTPTAAVATGTTAVPVAPAVPIVQAYRAVPPPAARQGPMSYHAVAPPSMTTPTTTTTSTTTTTTTASAPLDIPAGVASVAVPLVPTLPTTSQRLVPPPLPSLAPTSYPPWFDPIDQGNNRELYNPHGLFAPSVNSGPIKPGAGRALGAGSSDAGVGAAMAGARPGLGAGLGYAGGGGDDDEGDNDGTRTTSTAIGEPEHTMFCKVFINIDDPDPSFDLLGRLRGPGGAYFNYITQLYGAHVSIEGRGSGSPLSQEPLHIHVTHHSQELFNPSRSNVVALVITTRVHYQRFCQQHGKQVQDPTRKGTFKGGVYYPPTIPHAPTTGGTREATLDTSEDGVGRARKRRAFSERGVDSGDGGGSGGGGRRPFAERGGDGRRSFREPAHGAGDGGQRRRFQEG